MEINYKELVYQIIEIANKATLADFKVMEDENISVEEGKKQFAKNNMLFRLDVCKRLEDAYRTIIEIG